MSKKVKAKNGYAWQWADGGLDLEVAAIKDAATFDQYQGYEGKIVSVAIIPRADYRRLKAAERELQVYIAECHRLNEYIGTVEAGGRAKVTEGKR